MLIRKGDVLCSRRSLTFHPGSIISCRKCIQAEQGAACKRGGVLGSRMSLTFGMRHCPPLPVHGALCAYWDISSLERAAEVCAMRWQRCRHTCRPCSQHKDMLHAEWMLCSSNAGPCRASPAAQQRGLCLCWDSIVSWQLEAADVNPSCGMRPMTTPRRQAGT